MMDYLINHFQSFAENYSLVMIELYLFLVAGLFAYWLKPFTSNRNFIIYRNPLFEMTLRDFNNPQSTTHNRKFVFL